MIRMRLQISEDKAQYRKKQRIAKEAQQLLINEKRDKALARKADLLATRALTSEVVARRMAVANGTATPLIQGEVGNLNPNTITTATAITIHAIEDEDDNLELITAKQPNTKDNEDIETSPSNRTTRTPTPPIGDFEYATFQQYTSEVYSAEDQANYRHLHGVSHNLFE